MMGFQEIISWYQKKIGTYDKQQWEHTIEQRILHGLTHVPKKTAKLKTELIDVDLVRGSSFPKAKPKHGSMTVMRLSLARLLLLPFYGHWWIQQTSRRVFILLLILYIFQLLNMILFFWFSSYMADEVTEHVSATEVLIPSAMMLVLSFLHSQIVAPHSAPTGHNLSSSKSRRMKRTKRRVLITSRARSFGSDSKSSPDTSSDKKFSTKEPLLGKFCKRVRLRRGSSEDPKLRNITGEFEPVCTGVQGDSIGKEKCSFQKNAVSSASGGRQRVRLQVENEELGDIRQAVEENREGDMCSREVTPLDDDGFESLNGNGSSENGEEVVEESGPQVGDLDECVHVVALAPESEEKTWVWNTRADSKSSSVHPDLEQTPISVITQPLAPLNLSEEEHHSTTNPSTPSSCIEDSVICKPTKALLSTPASHQKPRNRDQWVQEILTNRKTSADSESDASAENMCPQPRERSTLRRRSSQTVSGIVTSVANESSYNSSCESEDAGTISSPGTGGSCPLLTEGTTSAAEWIGVTTNSEECSYSSEPDESDSQREFTGSNSVELNDHPFAWEFELSPTVLLNPSCAASDKVSCTIWEKRDPKKADLSVLDISSAIIARVESMPENIDYFYAGVASAVFLAVLPSVCRLVRSELSATEEAVDSTSETSFYGLTFASCWSLHISGVFISWFQCALGSNGWERIIILIAMCERGMLAALFFFLLAVAERTFKQRFLYAKLFSHLTSFRRARKSDLPHFRLNKVRNIKTWLSVRSYLKRRGPQRSVDVIVSAAFLIALLLLSFLSVECLKESVHLHSENVLEALAWCLALGAFLLRFMTLGTKINRKYRNLSVLITEQINLYLQIEQKPNKKEELMVANSVLKLAADLLKELESPFKISGLSANPYLYTITKVVILSALSGVLSEMLGFKLKLHKIKINHS